MDHDYSKSRQDPLQTMKIMLEKKESAKRNRSPSPSNQRHSNHKVARKRDADDVSDHSPLCFPWIQECGVVEHTTDHMRFIVMFPIGCWSKGNVKDGNIEERAYGARVGGEKESQSFDQS